MEQYHQGPYPEPLACVAEDGLAYEIAVREDAPEGVAALLVQLELSAFRSSIPTQLRLHFKAYGEAPVCALQLDCYDPCDEEDRLEDSLLIQSMLNHRPLQIELTPTEPEMIYRLLFDPREEGGRQLLVALATAGYYLVEFYDGAMTRRLTKRFSLQNAFSAAAQRVLDTTVAHVPGSVEALDAWQRAKERFLQEFRL